VPSVIDRAAFALFERLRFRYIGLLDWSLRHRGRVLTAFMGLSVASLGLVWLVGQDFFPNVDSGQMRLHARAPAGTRIEQTEVRFAAIEREIREIIPADEVEELIDNIGIPNSWTSLAQGDIPTISSADGEILISLNKEKHGPSRDYEVRLRKHLSEKFPDMTFFSSRPISPPRS
jgi:multidrug efflux pump subunit AcrB